MATEKPIRYGISTGLPDSPVGLPDEQFALVVPLYRGLLALSQQLSIQTGVASYSVDTTQKLGINEIDVGTNTRLKVIKADDALTYGKLIYLVSGTGYTEAHAKLAGNTVHLAHGICVEPNGVAVGKKGKFLLFRGLVTGLSGFTPGNEYWLGTGGLFATSNPGGIAQQKVAIAMTSSSIELNIQWQ